ncbi:hypothetical protein [Streptomyces sp. NPDC058045]|uniref:hypothetical protein n=1 Tax=Streptomyces sp. NPDC058045 TaxID=3346311 RepID=UPI0036E9358A
MPSPLPRRTPEDRIRRATVADGASSFDGFPPIDWIKDTGAPVSPVLVTWAAGQCAVLPIGICWDVVRLPIDTGSEALRQLHALGSTIGPAIASLDSVEVLVPVHSADAWDLPGCSVLQIGEHLVAPSPLFGAPSGVDGRTWLHRPGADCALTNGDDLYAAFAAALATVSEETAPSTSPRGRP